MQMNRPLTYKIIWWLIVLAMVAGMTAPMMTFTLFYFFDDTYSLAAGIFHLLDEGEPVLFVLIFGFSMLLPAYKMYLLYGLIPVVNRIPDRDHLKRVKHLDQIGKWSMLDVFVIALLVVTIKLGTIANIQIHYGLYLFSGAVISSMVFSQLLHSLVRKSNGQDR